VATLTSKMPIQPIGDDSLIFVTVGTTLPFDELLSKVDRLASDQFFGEKIICQGGQSRYRIINGEQFVGRPTIADLIAESTMVITHGGLTVLQCLAAYKPFVAFPNPRCAGEHQLGFLTEIATMSNISWSRNVSDLRALYSERRLKGPASIKSELPRAADVIRRVL
jgi:UDP-N-acetylglucosamine transferase subunit ALG13